MQNYYGIYLQDVVVKKLSSCCRLQLRAVFFPIWTVAGTTLSKLYLSCLSAICSSDGILLCMSHNDTSLLPSCAQWYFTAIIIVFRIRRLRLVLVWERCCWHLLIKEIWLSSTYLFCIAITSRDLLRTEALFFQCSNYRGLKRVCPLVLQQATLNSDKSGIKWVWFWPNGCLFSLSVNKIIGLCFCT